MPTIREYSSPKDYRDYEVQENGRVARNWPSLQWKRLLLPSSKVHPNYYPYQIYDSLQGLASYIRGVVATARVLEAAGVGSADASAVAAALVWVQRDGLSMLLGLWLAATWEMDSQTKVLRLVADLANDLAYGLDMLAPSMPFLLTISALCKTVCGLAAGASKAAITQHLGDNVAELQAKEGAQETVVNLLGMLLGALLVHTQHAPWTWFTILTAIHVWANYRAVRLLQLRTLNRERALLALQDAILTPEQVDESLWDSFVSLVWRSPIQKPLVRLLRDQPLADLKPDQRFVVVGRHVALLAPPTPVDQLQAFLAVHGRALTRDQTENLLRELQAKGWETDRLLLGIGPGWSSLTEDKED